ncbi:MAG: NAD(P)/FAD-dependent oxidoreductase [Arcobacteraceae bacterium]|nr:NAD(P)/FAD-dependent oxidoreductase [Arcobacteraceae bacterium]
MNNLKNTKKYNIAIIGAGASGLLASIFLTKKNHTVTIFEKNNKVGKKLLATGNGRCNVTNENISLNNFYSHSDIQQINPILENFNYKKCKNFFNNIGVEFVNNEIGRVYPMSQNSSSIVDSLEYEALNNGVKIELNSKIEDISYDEQYYIINGKKYDKLIIATGSTAMPKLGGDKSGYNFAKQFHHSTIDPFASLVQLVSDNKNLEMISGVKVDGVVENKQGDILFTKYGLSGSAILDISRDISYKLQHQKSVKVTVDILPTFSKNKLVDMLLQRAKTLASRDIYVWLDGIVNKKLSRYIIIESKIPENIKFAKFLNRKDILKIVHTIKNLEFNITDTKGFETCEVCAGGVILDDINLHTMESKLQKNLYFIGEVLDVDGDCGGYNLHFAWASGYTLAQNLR